MSFDLAQQFEELISQQSNESDTNQDRINKVRSLAAKLKLEQIKCR